MTPTVETHIWPLPPDLLVIAVEDDTGLTTVTLTVSAGGPVAGPGDALVELVHALAGARLAVTPQEPPHE